MANLQICGGSYKLKAPVSQQECINLFPEVEKRGSKEQIVLRSFPGLRLFSSLGGVVRGMDRMAGTLFVVAGTTLYSINSAGASTSIGTIAGSGNVSMANDGTNLVIVNGTATGYHYDSSTLSTIADPDFITADLVFYLDTYFVFHETGTNRYFISAAADPTDYTATDFKSKEGAPGNIITMITSHRDLILLGEKTAEIHRNIGDPDFPFARQEGSFVERGATGAFCSVLLDNTVYFLGNDKVVYALVGYRPVRISHHAIEKWISEQTKADLDAATGIGITYQGHYFYILSFPFGTWAYDATVSAMMEESEWFQLKSWDKENWRVTHATVAYGKTLCGGEDGDIYELDPDTYTENGTLRLKQRVTPYYHSEHHPVSCSRLELGFEQGVANGDVIDPKVFLEISKDGGRTWGSRRERSMGALGEYKEKAVWRRNGRAFNWLFKFYVTDDVDVTITGGYGEFEVGTG